MTTTISIPTKDCIVLACDSLATYMDTFIEPRGLSAEFFDEKGGLKLGEDGVPLLKSFEQLAPHVRSLAVNQIPSVTKLFELSGRKVGLLFAGASGIADESIAELLEDFERTIPRELFPGLETGLTEVRKLADDLKDYLVRKFVKAHGEEFWDLAPAMDITVSGYSQDSHRAEIYKIKVGKNSGVEDALQHNRFWMVTGGQSDVIERIMFGMDDFSFARLRRELLSLFTGYRREIARHLKTTVSKVPEFSNIDKLDDAFINLPNGANFSVGGFSEQAAIDLAYFLVETMVKSQEFSFSTPTVGGDIHVALIRPRNGFTWISEEAFVLNGHKTRKFDEKESSEK